MAIKIFIDQAHNPDGFPDSGETGYNLRENEITYAVGKYLEGFLRNDPRFEVMLSRPEPDTVVGTDAASSREERVRMANEWPADFFISLHTNTDLDTQKRGAEVFIKQYNTLPNWFGSNIMNGILQMTSSVDGGIHEGEFYTLNAVNTPSIILSLGYLSNITDANILRDEQYRFAHGIYRGMLEFFGFI